MQSGDAEPGGGRGGCRQDRQGRLCENVTFGLGRLPPVAAGVERSGGGTLQAEGRARRRYEGERDLPAGRTEREWDSF